MSKKNKKINTLITQDQPKSTISEKFRSIRSNIMFSNANSEITDILITSEKPGAGKSTIAANVAITYAQAGYKVLIIDGDMRKPSLHYIFNETNQQGLSNLIIGRVMDYDAIKPTEINNLDLLTSGPVPPNPSELIGSKKFSALYQRMTEKYDFIVIDTPPVTTVTDAQIYARTVENIVLVVDVEKNDKNEIKKAKKLIENTGNHVLGVVLNKTKPTKSSSYYYYYGEE